MCVTAAFSQLSTIIDMDTYYMDTYDMNTYYWLLIPRLNISSKITSLILIVKFNE